MIHGGLAFANESNGKKHGGKGHNKIVDKIIKDARDKGAKEIRKNQQQVDINGNKVGRNKPDVQYNYKGKHYNIEVDTTLRVALDIKALYQVVILMPEIHFG